MKTILEIVILGSLLHDIGKTIYRSGRDGRNHSTSGADFLQKMGLDSDVIQCVRYHHKDALLAANLQSNHPAHIVYLADNLSSGSDRRKVEGEEAFGFNKLLPMSSIFNLLNNGDGKQRVKADVIAETPPEQLASGELTSEQYSRLFQSFADALNGIDHDTPYLNSLLEIVESCFSYVPCSTQIGEVADISLYSHMKITAAYASCITLYCQEHGIHDLRKALVHDEKAFCNDKVFLLASVDLSGIQAFIYQLPSKAALKGMRVRSFYLEVLLENTVDELLSACGLSRVNLLYTGGGHAYMLLANTQRVQETLDSCMSRINAALTERFGTALFIAHSTQICSANELMSKTNDPEAYPKLFRALSAKISRLKLSRYRAEDIIRLNNRHPASAERECSVCGNNAASVDVQDGVCTDCRAFSTISTDLLAAEAVFLVTNSKPPDDVATLPLFSGNGTEQFLRVMDGEAAKAFIQNCPQQLVRLYSKNLFRTGYALASKLWMGDHAAKDERGRVLPFEDLAQGAKGIKRLAVLRADVDNLGAAFTQGFVRHHEAEPNRYLTLSRTASFSASMSIFFKYYINGILDRPVFKLRSGKRDGNSVIVYSGGDDLFLVGAWDEIFCAAIDLHSAFQRFCGGSLTLSAGIAVFDAKHPISAMARETGRLEDEAKAYIADGISKDAISLFGLSYKDGKEIAEHTYHWDTFREQVVGEKLELIDRLLQARDDLGHGFLYQLVELMQNAASDRINIARLAYILARRDCPVNASPECKQIYREFTRKVYTWVMDDAQRRQLLTALMIFVYTDRGMKEENEHEQ